MDLKKEFFVKSKIFIHFLCIIFMKKKIIYLLFLAFTAQINAQTPYFPPTTGNTWETTSPASLGWCVNKIDPFYTYLEQTNSKAVIVLKDGKIVMEKYFGTFTQDSLWYWASAGKTLTSFLVGVAQDEGKLSLNDLTSKHLGKGWTSETKAKEDLITVRNQLTMTSGLDDTGLNKDCTDAACLTYKADAGNRWAYHNAPYTLLDKVVEAATGMAFNQYCNSKLRTKIGMNGIFVKSGYNNVNYSNARSMARFGLLMLNKGKWNNTQLLSESYFTDATNTSQQLNKSYGYLWWLNGKGSYMLPTLQTVFPGNLAADAPKDMFSALGKNGQIINIVPSQNLVLIRMGNSDGSPVPTTYDNEIWKKFNEILCKTTRSEDMLDEKSITISPNPAQDKLTIYSDFILKNADIQVFNQIGQQQNIVIYDNSIETIGLENGIYFLSIKKGSERLMKRFVVLH
jgi:CubicO group peptidase (beta-lactamase class C family)